MCTYRTYDFSLPFGLYVETCTSFYAFSGPKWPSSRVHRNIGHLSKYPIIRSLPIIGRHRPRTISLRFLKWPVIATTMQTCIGAIIGHFESHKNLKCLLGGCLSSDFTCRHQIHHSLWLSVSDYCSNAGLHRCGSNWAVWKPKIPSLPAKSVSTCLGGVSLMIRRADSG